MKSIKKYIILFVFFSCGQYPKYMDRGNLNHRNNNIHQPYIKNKISLNLNTPETPNNNTNSHEETVMDRPFVSTNRCSSTKNEKKSQVSVLFSEEKDINPRPSGDGIQYDYKNNKLTFHLHSGYSRFTVTKTIYEVHKIFKDKKRTYKSGYYRFYNLIGELLFYNCDKGIYLFKDINNMSDNEKKYSYFEIYDDYLYCRGDYDLAATFRSKDNVLSFEEELDDDVDALVAQKSSQKFDIEQVCFSFIEFDNNKDERKISDDRFKSIIEDVKYDSYCPYNYYFVSIRDRKYGNYFPNSKKDKYMIMEYAGTRFPKNHPKNSLGGMYIPNVQPTDIIDDIYTLSIFHTRRNIRCKRFKSRLILDGLFKKYNINQILPLEVAHIVAKYL